MNPLFQQKFFEKIIALHPSKTQAVAAVSQLLDLNASNVYRRITGDLALRSEQLVLLARHFGISLDELLFEQDTRHIFFRYNAFAHTEAADNPVLFLEKIHQQLADIQQLTDPRVYFVAAELPIFHTFTVPELAWFKLYVWRETIWRKDSRPLAPFNLRLLTPTVATLLREIATLYNQLPSVEIWNDTVIEILLRQFQYYHTAGIVGDTDAALLRKSLFALLNRLNAAARKGNKLKETTNASKAGSFRLFINDMLHTTNTILVRSAYEERVFVTHDNPHFFSTSHPQVAANSFHWIERLAARSVLISQTNETQREAFFKSLTDKVEAQDA